MEPSTSFLRNLDIPSDTQDLAVREALKAEGVENCNSTANKELHEAEPSSRRRFMAELRSCFCCLFADAAILTNLTFSAMTQLRGIANDEEKLDFIESLFGLDKLLVIIIMIELNSRKP
jgi:hypothetical protein